MEWERNPKIRHCLLNEMCNLYQDSAESNKLHRSIYLFIIEDNQDLTWLKKSFHKFFQNLLISTEKYMNVMLCHFIIDAT